jgi:hypothetical protein
VNPAPYVCLEALLSYTQAVPRRKTCGRLPFTRAGVLLYKLLAGTGPFVIPSMRLTDIERAICEKDPPLPSHAIDDADVSGRRRPRGAPRPELAQGRAPYAP